MATAARLSVIVDANTRAAVSNLSRFDSSLKRSSSTAGMATKSTGTLDRATKGLGSRMASAAKYAAGAAAAYLSVAQAKAAVTTTQELAKTTAGLANNLGLANTTASKWGAVARARGVDGKQLSQAFGTLAKNIDAAQKGGETQIATFKAMGITMEDLKGKNFEEQLELISDGMERMGSGTERTAASMKLFGRGWQTVVPLMRDGSTEMNKNLDAARKYGNVLAGNTLKQQMRLTAETRESSLAWQGLQVTFTQAVTPALIKANNQFQSLARIMGNDDLTNAEKFEKIGNRIERWADRAFEAFIGVLPKIAEEAGEKAPKIAAAFVEGFVNANAMGKLAIGGWMFSNMGGPGAFRGLGTKGGGYFAAAFVLAAESIELGNIIRDAVEGHELQQTTREAVSVAFGDLGLDVAGFIGRNKIAVDTAWGRLIFDSQTQKVVKSKGRALEDFTGKTAKEVAVSLGNEIADKSKAVKWDKLLDGFKKILDKLPPTVKTDTDRAFGLWDGWLENMKGRTRNKGGDIPTILEKLFGDAADAADKKGRDTFDNWDDWLNRTANAGRTKGDNFKNALAASFADIAQKANDSGFNAYNNWQTWLGKMESLPKPGSGGGGGGKGKGGKGGKSALMGPTPRGKGGKHKGPSKTTILEWIEQMLGTPMIEAIQSQNIFEAALSNAGLTGPSEADPTGKADDLTALGGILGAQQTQTAHLTTLLQGELAKPKKKQNPKRIFELYQQLASLASGSASTQQQINDILTPDVPDASGGGSTDTGPTQAEQAIIDAQEAAAIAAQELAAAQAAAAAEMAALRASVDQQNAIASSELSVGLTEARRALADMISGQIGSNAYSRSNLAGAGAATRY